MFIHIYSPNVQSYLLWPLFVSEFLFWECNYYWWQRKPHRTCIVYSILRNMNMHRNIQYYDTHSFSAVLGLRLVIVSMSEKCAIKSVLR